MACGHRPACTSRARKVVISLRIRARTCCLGTLNSRRPCPAGGRCVPWLFQPVHPPFVAGRIVVLNLVAGDPWLQLPDVDSTERLLLAQIDFQPARPDIVAGRPPGLGIVIHRLVGPELRAPGMRTGRPGHTAGGGVAATLAPAAPRKTQLIRMSSFMFCSPWPKGLCGYFGASRLWEAIPQWPNLSQSTFGFHSSLGVSSFVPPHLDSLPYALPA